MSTKADSPRRRRAIRTPPDAIARMAAEPAPPPADVPITPAQRREIFAQHYALHHNASQAARAAGLGEKSAASAGRRMLQHPHVKRLLSAATASDRRRIARIARKLEVTRETIIDELARLGFSNVLDYGRIEGGQFVLDLADTPREEMAAVKKLKVEERVLVGASDDDGPRILGRTTTLELSPKREALVDLAKIIGLLRDEGPPPSYVTFNIIGLSGSTPETHRVTPPPAQKRDPTLVPGTHEFIDPARR